MRRTGIRAAMLVVGVLLAVGASADAAAAHAALESARPENGASLSRAPREVVLEFTEAPDPGLSEFDVLDATGGSVLADGAPRIGGDGRTVILPLETLPNGTYVVSYRVVSSVDGHPTSNSIAFGVGEQAPPPRTGGAETFPAPSPLAVASRWSLYWGLAVLLAAATSFFFVFRGPVKGSGPVLAIAWVLAAAGSAALPAAAARAADVGVWTLLDSQTGEPFLRQAIAVAVAGIAAVVAIRRRTSWSAAVLGGAAAVAFGFHALGGHAGAQTDGRAAAVLVQWLHMVAAGVWIGGLVWLLVGARSTTPQARTDPILRFSRVATIALALVVLTGLLRSVELLGGAGGYLDLFATSWGTALFFKLVPFVALVALAAWNHFVRIPRLRRTGASGLLRAVGVEIALAALVFGVTGVLAGLPPAGEALAESSRPAAPAVIATGEDFATTVRVELAIFPGRPGPNQLSARIVDYDTGEVVPAQRVSMTAELPDRPQVRPAEIDLTFTEGRWRASTSALAVEGRWEGILVVQQAATSTEVALTFDLRAPPPEVTVAQGVEGLPDIATLAYEDGRSLQLYVDPAEPGASQFHLTAFAPDGTELPLRSVTIRAKTPDGRSQRLRPTQVSPGHVVAPVQLVLGSWRFDVEAEPDTGSALSGGYDQEIAT